MRTLRCLGSLQEARAAEERGELELAATIYEEILAEGNRTLDVFLDLAVMYWQATDFGLIAAKNLSKEFISRAATRAPELLSEATLAFPESTEAEFWLAYIRWADLGDALTVQQCKTLLQRDPGTLVPAMHVFGQTDGQDCIAEAMELRRQCATLKTRRCSYIVSVIEGVSRRTGLRSNTTRP